MSALSIYNNENKKQNKNDISVCNPSTCWSKIQQNNMTLEKLGVFFAEIMDIKKKLASQNKMYIVF